jgi:hypothetical protein
MAKSEEQYVRLLAAPNTRMGTITRIKIEHGRTQYLFHQDERINAPIRDFWAEEGDFELCDRPTDDHVNVINGILARR